MDTWMCTAESLCCPHASITALLIGDTQYKILEKHGVPHNCCYHVAPLTVEQRPWINQLCQQGGSPLGSA